ncbi:DNAj [Anaeramoeba flamelloides]|uniref:DNAj n=1 Tax=Anaeramoeba flamelloides TaxID=1746091 RepID=A0AAV7ZUI8_9EUKA|nr:DNAj [Anaeramoeba flamelloides]
MSTPNEKRRQSILNNREERMKRILRLRKSRYSDTNETEEKQIQNTGNESEKEKQKVKETEKQIKDTKEFSQSNQNSETITKKEKKKQEQEQEQEQVKDTKEFSQSNQNSEKNEEIKGSGKEKNNHKTIDPNLVLSQQKEKRKGTETKTTKETQKDRKKKKNTNTKKIILNRIISHIKWLVNKISDSRSENNQDQKNIKTEFELIYYESVSKIQKFEKQAEKYAFIVLALLLLIISQMNYLIPWVENLQPLLCLIILNYIFSIYNFIKIVILKKKLLEKFNLLESGIHFFWNCFKVYKRIFQNSLFSFFYFVVINSICNLVRTKIKAL